MRQRLTILLFVIFSFVELYSQSDTLIYSLQGIEDGEGNTHLFYKAKYINFTVSTDTVLDYVYTFNESTGEEIPFLNGYSITYYPENHTEVNLICGIDFIGGNPDKYIYVKNQFGIDGNWNVSRYDTNNVLNGGFTPASGLFVSRQDTNIVFIISGRTIYKSEDGGFSVADSNIYQIDFDYLAFSPFDDNIIFGIANDGSLVKSIDQGRTFSIVDQSVNWNYVDTLLFDIDQKHIYAIYNKQYTGYFRRNTSASLLSSDSGGNSGSWKILKNFDSRINICIDDSISGTIFYAFGNEIYKSTDYGLDFEKFAETENFAAGLYKKPGENVLFVANINGVMKITNDSTQWLVGKSVKRSLDYFPLQVGNKWIYEYSGVSYDIEPHPFSGIHVKEVKRDSIFPNGKKYFLISNFYSTENWVRIDSASGKIYINDGTKDNLVDNLLATSGDHLDVYRGEFYEVFLSDTVVWNKKRLKKSYYYASFGTDEKVYCQGLGVLSIYDEFDFGYSLDTLKGCVINGVVYGDTALVGIKEIQNEIPANFVLYQNYPNPFNPSTTITYTIPTSETLHATSQQLVQLKIYDVLGREIATLVNKKQPPGRYRVNFNAGNLPSGIYYYRLKTNFFSETKKMLLLK